MFVVLGDLLIKQFSWLFSTVLNFLQTAKYITKLAEVLITRNRWLTLMRMKNHSGA